MSENYYYDDPEYFISEAAYPAYLGDIPPAPRTYGTLTYSARTKAFTIKGNPQVCLMAKTVIAGCSGRGRDSARFSAHHRSVAQLNWLMMRYPLEIGAAARTVYEGLLQAARQYATMRQQALISPPVVVPDSSHFSGELLDFQKEGAGFLCANNRVLLADEMGLGKTVQALAFLAEKRCYPALIVVPPHLTTNWRREIARFLRVGGEEPRVHVLRGLKPYNLPPADIYIIHYLLLRGWKTALPKLGLHCAIFDEVQELRHRSTEKYSAASLLSESCENVIGLSGTPIYNRGAEIWNVINILDYHSLGDFESFSRTWCHGYGGDIVANPQQLGEYLRDEGYIFRRTKDQVLRELPKKRRLVETIEMENDTFRRLMAPLRAMAMRLSEGDLSPSEKSLLLEQVSSAERQATGIAKAPFVCVYVRALLDAGMNVLLFAHHHAVMDIYRAELKKHRPVFITGRETQKEKDASISKFMDGKTNICCVSLRAAAGLNLQRANCVVFGELDWSPAVHTQAEDRAHRIGQRDSVLCYYLVAPGGSDSDMQDALGLKISQFVGLMGDNQSTADEMLRASKQAKDYLSEMITRIGQSAM